MKRLNKNTNKPWGIFHDLAESRTKWHLKVLVIKKGSRLSLQRHALRSEFWIVAEGKVNVQKGNSDFVLIPTQSIFIKKNEIHRIEALSNAVIVEISFGHHKETDIVRLADDYGRVTSRPTIKKSKKKKTK